MDNSACSDFPCRTCGGRGVREIVCDRCCGTGRIRKADHTVYTKKTEPDDPQPYFPEEFTVEV